MTQAFSPNTGEAGAGDSQGQPGHSGTLSEN